jgi:lysophospholipase L1-like esterase
MPLTGFSSVVPSQVWDNKTSALAGSAPNQYYPWDPFSRVVLTGAFTSLTVEYVAIASGVTDALAVLVNGAWTQTITANSFAYGVKVQQTITLPAGVNTVEIVNDPNVWVTGVSATGYDFVLPVAPARRLVAYGDSIAAGYLAGPRFASYLPPQRATGRWGGVTMRVAAGTTVYDDTANGTNIGAIATALVLRCDGTLENAIYIEKVTNDYGLDHESAATFGTVYAGLLDAIHALNPSIQIYCQTPFHRSGETTPQSIHGSTLADFGAAIVAAVSTRTTFATVIDGYAAFSIAQVSAGGGDGLHPGTALHAATATWLAGQFPALPTPPAGRTAKFQMQGRNTITQQLVTWLTDAPDWAGANAMVPVADVALSVRTRAAN